MTYQLIRGSFEDLTATALQAAGLPVGSIYFDNYGETPKDASKPYAVISLSFGSTIEDVVGCEGSENLNGPLQCNVYTPKDQASVDGEAICLSVLRAWNAVNRHGHDPAPLLSMHTRSIDGPTTIAPDERPHHVNVISCIFSARAA